MKKIFPYLASNDPTNSFKIVFISEGYLAEEKGRFMADCLEFADTLLTVCPFDMTKVNPNWISIYSAFTPSNNSGPSIDETAAGNRTAFESFYDSVNKTLAINQAKIKSFIEAEQIESSFGRENLSHYCRKGIPNLSSVGNGTLIVVLLPALKGQPAGAEFEYEPGNDDYYFIAVSKDGLWYQVVIRALCKTLGLGDEYELEGDDKLAPAVSDQNLIFHFNLEYFPDTAPSLPSHSLNWMDLFSPKEKQQPVPAHLKSGSTANADNSIDAIPVLHTKIEYWEGAGGFRTKVFRSAKDCLLRRKIGSAQLPLRVNEVPFCPACTHFIKSII